MIHAENAAPSRNGTGKHDPVASIRTFLQNAAPDLQSAFGTAIEAAEAESRPVCFGDLALALLDCDAVNVRLPRKRVQSAVETLNEHRDKWTVTGRRSFGFDLEKLIKQVGDEREPDAVAFLAAALRPGAITDAQSQIVCGVLRDLRITTERLLNPPCPVPGTDLTQLARERGAAAPRVVDAVLRSIVAFVQGGQFVALLGEIGVGKSHLIDMLARHIVHRTPPLVDDDVARWRLLRITRGDLLGGKQAQPDLQLRLLFAYAARTRDLVLVFDDAHALFADPVFGPAFIAALRSACGSGARVILVTNTADYGRYVRADDALHTRLTVLTISEPEPNEAASRLKSGRDDLMPEGASESLITIDDGAIDRAVELTAEFAPTEKNPRKSAVTVTAALAERSYHVSRGDRRTTLTAADVTAAFAERSGIPIEDLSPNPEVRYARLESALAERVRGQDRAITGVTRHLCRRALGIGDPRRPLGRFLFLGPPGCGKTELALCVAEMLYRDRAANWMQNFGALQGSAAVYALRGAPPGHIGYGDPTVFTHLETRPRSVVVFDELDKAPMEVAGCLLDVLDGRARDARSRDVSTSNAIFCFTTNALQDWATPDMPEHEVREELVRLGGVFTPPLVDRLDGIFVFESLSEEALLLILDDLFARRKRGMRRQVPEGVWTDDVRRDLVRRAAPGDRSSSVRRLESELDRYLAQVTDTNGAA